MSNVFLNIPFFAGNGAGAAVDVAPLGATKTFIVGGVFDATVQIEYSTQVAAPVVWAPVPSGTFAKNKGRVQVDLAAKWVRLVTSAFKSGAANVDVGAPYAPASFVQIPGDGTPVDISFLPPFKTFVVNAPCILEVSEDGTDYSQVWQFMATGAQSGIITGQFARLSGIGPTAPTAWLGGAAPGIDAEPSSGSLAIQGAGTFTPIVATNVPAVANSGMFVSPGVYLGTGHYQIHMVAIPGVTDPLQVVATALPRRPQMDRYMVAQTLFDTDHVVVDIHVLDGAAVADSDFYLHCDVLAP